MTLCKQSHIITCENTKIILHVAALNLADHKVKVVSHVLQLEVMISCVYNMNIWSRFMLLNDFWAKYSNFLCYETYVKVCRNCHFYLGILSIWNNLWMITLSSADLNFILSMIFSAMEKNWLNWYILFSLSFRLD